MALECMGLFFRKPEQFFVIATAGYICIGIGMILYTFGVYRRGQEFFKPLDRRLPEWRNSHVEKVGCPVDNLNFS